MGMIGATAACLLRLWRVEKNNAAWMRLRSTLGIVLFQFLFDLSTPEVSLTAHLGGVIAGFLIAMTMRQKFTDSISLSPRRPLG
jgi:membrane associated rhomboid family serine protease